MVCKTLTNAGIPFDFKNDEQWCHICDLVKFTKIPVPPSQTQSPRFLHTLCEDTFPLHTESYYHHRHCMIIYDRFSHTVWSHWVKHKDENPELFIQCVTDLEVKYNLPVVIIQSDRGELHSKRFLDFCQNHKPNRIEHHMSPANTQVFNGDHWYY